MKVRAFWKFGLVLALLVLPALGGWWHRPSSSAPGMTDASAAESETAVAPEAAAEEEDLLTDEPAGSEVSDAPVQPVAMEKRVPPNVNPTRPVSEMIQLAALGTGEGVMLAFVTNSTASFDLRADEIIYLKDIGVPDGVLAAMIARDEQLRGDKLKLELQPEPDPLAYADRKSV